MTIILFSCSDKFSINIGNIQMTLRCIVAKLSEVKLLLSGGPVCVCVSLPEAMLK